MSKKRHSYQYKVGDLVGFIFRENSSDGQIVKIAPEAVGIIIKRLIHKKWGESYRVHWIDLKIVCTQPLENLFLLDEITPNDSENK